MPPIRKGDGTAVVPKGISQVRTGDGRILFDGPAIPDSEGDHQWNFDEGSGTTVSDSIGGLDAAFTSISDWPTDAGAGGVYAELDGSEYADLGSESRSELSPILRDAEFTLGFWVRRDDTSDSYLLGTEGDSSADTVLFQFRSGETIRFRTFGGGSELSDSGSVSVNAPTGEWAFYSVSADGSRLKTFEAYGPDYNVTELDDSSISTHNSDFDENVYLAGRNDSDERPFTGGFDLSFAEMGNGLSESELQAWVDDTKHFYE